MDHPLETSARKLLAWISTNDSEESEIAARVPLRVERTCGFKANEITNISQKANLVDVV